MNKATKILLEVILAAIAVGLVYLLYSSIMQPVNFNKEKDSRQAVAVQRLKDIRTLQVAYKSVTGKFNSSIDSLKQFYENGQMSVVMQVGSMDDSLAVAHTEAVKKARRGKITNAELYDLYLNGDKNLVFSVENKIPVRDTLFNGRTDFSIDSLKYIPFSGKEPIQMEAATKMVSGVPVPLFEARIPWKSLLKGMNNQLRINLDAESRDLNRYEGLQVGSITAPNNNAGNWE
jgi:hypothetical protein